MKARVKAALSVAVLFSLPLAAHAGGDHGSSNGATHGSPPAVTSGAQAEMSEGEVRKVSKDTGKITIRHGELKNLDMPPMTMVFRVTDPAMLDQVKTGDKVNFVADKVGGQFTVTRIETKK